MNNDSHIDYKLSKRKQSNHKIYSKMKHGYSKKKHFAKLDMGKFIKL
jgi:hypothetical protein